MSLADLTRNCFQSGIPSSKWLSLCRLLISKEHGFHDSTAAETDLSNSVLVLYRSYPGDPDLLDYLKFAIQDGLLSAAVFVATLLQAARSPELHAPTTLDSLCRLALDIHYSSGLSPVGSVVPYGESPITVLGTVQDALALLRTAHSLPISPFHQLTTSASELVILLLSCVSDISQVSTAQAMVHFADANSLLQNFRLATDVRQVLETFVLSLSLLLGDDAKAAREAQIMHTLQLALGKGDILGASSNTDIITFGLAFHHMISYRAQDFGSGDSSGSVALLVGLFRWASWTPLVFCTQLFISALTCMAQSHGNALLWKSFIVSRLPRLLILFEKVVNADGVTQADWRRAIQAALLEVSRRTDLIAQCDQVLSTADGSTIPQEESLRSFLRDLLQYAMQVELIDMSFAIEGDPLISNYNIPGLHSEARDAGLELESYIESKIAPDTGVEDLQPWIDRVWRDAGSHGAFADVALRRFTTLATLFDAESLSHLCRLLYTYEAVLDILAIHVKICDIVFRALHFLEQYDYETVGDPQTAVTHLGDVVLFVQYTIARFHLESRSFTLEDRTLSAGYLTTNDVIYSVENLSGDDAVAFSAWFKALFDSNSEGIEDSILRSTQPRTLLRISVTLFSQAIQARFVQQIDGDVLNNGVSYFTGPLLSWTLVGVVKALAREIQLRGFSAPIHLEILQTLLLSTCPRPVLSLCSPRILALFNDKNGKTKAFPPGIDISSVRRVVGKALGLKHNANMLPSHSLSTHTHRENEPRQSIQAVMALARSGKAPSLYIDRCIKIMPPAKFIHLLWSELTVSASLGEMESCRRIATFVLTMPRSPNTPPLLPIFLFIVLPSLIAVIDLHQPPEQTMDLELLVTIVSSVLTAALHLELAIRLVMREHPSVLGQPTTAIARRFAAELRERKNSHTSVTILQRLASSQSFVANFPVFMNDLA